MSQVERTRLISLAPLAAGWRAVYPSLWVKGELATLPDDELFWVFPVAALAHVELEYDDGDDDTEVRVIHGGGDGLSGWWDDERHIALIGPGEEVEPWVRDEAIRAIEAARKERAKRIAERQAA